MEHASYSTWSCLIKVSKILFYLWDSDSYLTYYRGSYMYSQSIKTQSETMGIHSWTYMEPKANLLWGWKSESKLQKYKSVRLQYLYSTDQTSH